MRNDLKLNELLTTNYLQKKYDKAYLNSYKKNIK